MLGFATIGGTGGSKRYLRQAGLHEDVKFLGLNYVATEGWEGFDIELETSDGSYFKERTFGPNIDKVFPKALYKDGQKVGMETKEQAYERKEMETSRKLFYLAACFSKDEKALRDSLGSVRTLKELVEGVKEIIGEPGNTINFLTIWKNSDAKQRSNLIVADRGQWCESNVPGRKSGLRLTKWQQDNQMIEKYPYGKEVSDTDESIIPDEMAQPESALPF